MGCLVHKGAHMPRLYVGSKMLLDSKSLLKMGELREDPASADDSFTDEIPQMKARRPLHLRMDAARWRTRRIRAKATAQAEAAQRFFSSRFSAVRQRYRGYTDTEGNRRS